MNPLHRGIDEMMRGHYFKMNENDEQILKRAIDESVELVVDELGVGKNIKTSIQECLPDSVEVTKEVDNAIKRTRRRR